MAWFRNLLGYTHKEISYWFSGTKKLFSSEGKMGSNPVPASATNKFNSNFMYIAPNHTTQRKAQQSDDSLWVSALATVVKKNSLLTLRTLWQNVRGRQESECRWVSMHLLQVCIDKAQLYQKLFMMWLTSFVVSTTSSVLTNWSNKFCC